MRLSCIATLLAIVATVGCSDDETTQAAATTAGAGGAGGAPAGLAALSDTFDGDALDPAWTVFNDDAVDATVAGGSLAMELTKPALWYLAQQGSLLHKSVTGNFKVTATVHTTKTSADEPPSSPIHLGGLMARNPASDGARAKEDYVFIVVGYDEDDISVETKSTTADESEYLGPTWPSTEAELRLCRVDAKFLVFKREIGDATWQSAASYDRFDLPETLQVGPNAYSLTTPDLTVRFDEVVFAEAADEAACDAD